MSDASEEKIPSYQEVVMETWQNILDHIPHLVFQLRRLDRATIRIHDAGIKLTAYYNCPNVMRIELQRLDKKYIFLPPLDIDERESEEDSDV